MCMLYTSISIICEWVDRILTFGDTSFSRICRLTVVVESSWHDPKALACVIPKFMRHLIICCPVNNQPLSSTFHLWTTTRPPQGLSVVYMPTLKFNSLRVYLSAKALRSTQSMRLLREDPLNQASHWVNIPHLWGLESSTRSIWG